MVRVKFCGMTSPDEAALAGRLGVDAVGILVGRVHAASDFVEIATAREICRTLPPFITAVLVTHLCQLEEIVDLARQVPCPAIQLHSDLEAEQLREIRRRLPQRKIIGKVSVLGNQALTRAESLRESVDALLLDSIDETTDRVGGTGIVHDWTISAAIASQTPVPVILAGGLNPTNVHRAIAAVRPWAVDVNSGVEDECGRKSERLMRQFVERVRSLI
jgi:phosphoribosylanthranilate isomerase